MLTIFAGGPLDEFYSATLPRGIYIHTESTGTTIEYGVYYPAGVLGELFDMMDRAERDA